jgi:hypothetical protein
MTVKVHLAPLWSCGVLQERSKHTHITTNIHIHIHTHTESSGSEYVDEAEEKRQKRRTYPVKFKRQGQGQRQGQQGQQGQEPKRKRGGHRIEGKRFRYDYEEKAKVVALFDSLRKVGKDRNSALIETISGKVKVNVTPTGAVP